MLRLVLDVACNRVIYFSEKDRLTTNDHVYVREWFEPLPMGMTHDNCWDWKLVGDKLVLDHQNTSKFPKTLLELNKERVNLYLIERVNFLRSKFLPSCSLGAEVRKIKLEEAKQQGGPLLEKLAPIMGLSLQELCEEIIFKDNEYRNLLMETEIFREQYKEKILLADSNEQVYRLRDEISEFEPGMPLTKHAVSIKVGPATINSTLLVK
ncbi:MAG: hypothetical protein EBU90_07115 [Proteobacteria bacterium]|nr:hypothetical protein [Pseudomonadota bacterium]